MIETPTYIKSLLIPTGKKATARRVWGIELETVWIPFFLATNAQGDSAIPSDALGAPLRLGYEADGSVKFTSKGYPQYKVEKDLADSIRYAKDNFTAGLLLHATQVATDNPEGYREQIESARKAGEPIRIRDKDNLHKAVAERREQAMAELLAEAERTAKVQAKEQAKAPKAQIQETAGITS